MPTLWKIWPPDPSPRRACLCAPVLRAGGARIFRRRDEGNTRKDLIAINVSDNRWTQNYGHKATPVRMVQMDRQHHHMARSGKAPRSWFKLEALLVILVAFLLFGFIYAYSSDADFYYAFAGALGMGAVLYAIIWLTARRKLWP
jgi:hypothetical protein